jgi:hypothetical protein
LTGVRAQGERLKAAILIMAHDQPAHFARLVEFLSCDWARIFVHVDRKVEIARFKRAIPKHRAPVFLDREHRVGVNWAGFSIVQAALSLLQASLNADESFDRFCLLSGSDFPIKSLDKIKEGFGSETEFIRIERRLDITDSNAHCRNVRYRHFPDSPLTRMARRLLRSSTRRLLRMPRKTYDKISLYQGSAWWALSRGCVRYIAEFIRHNKDYVRFHKHTWCSDEIFFHSIVKASPFASRISHDFETADDTGAYFASNEHGCHYINWNEGGAHPKTLSDADFESLMSSEALFARKFAAPVSNNLLNRICDAVGGQPVAEERTSSAA